MIRDRLSQSLGRVQYLRGKSQWYLETARAWITPSAALGVYVKYLGVSGRWSVALAVLVPVVVEGVGFILGKFLWDHGGVEMEYRLAMERDPYKVQHLAALQDLKGEVRRLGAMLERLGDGARQ